MQDDNSNGITRRDLGTLAAAALAIAPTLAPKAAAGQSAPAKSAGPEHDIADWSYHLDRCGTCAAGSRHDVQRDADVCGALDPRGKFGILIRCC